MPLTIDLSRFIAGKSTISLRLMVDGKDIDVPSVTIINDRESGIHACVTIMLLYCECKIYCYEYGNGNHYHCSNPEFINSLHFKFSQRHSSKSRDKEVDKDYSSRYCIAYTSANMVIGITNL